ncbi:DEAD/DEAH box helicase domain protein [Halorhabdus utahensis DSM 12940]|uniref:DEAD/DEAH box helicase domain protein n=1 Tax=Halorhabdus utahensis (strain DSM 12940 / JCM 11049 / AX-2) TaxID=519442 RepID=C7NV26_HALUD|nr:DEAD/DEAH box helicase [Halorhabdus utahensis]ACV12438.1 DEAD/DEAH box helicase domain protein [Halorhabdus utahensis DSM 12940]
MDDVLPWLRERPYYEGQIADERRFPDREATDGDLDVSDRLASALEDQGVDRFYRHQADAIEAVRDGENVVLATPTASGKSLAYTVPAFERAMDHVGTTLYIAPQVALINDQAETLSDLAHGLGFGSRVTVDRYTGRLSKGEKETVRERQPTVLLTTPDMLHYGIMPHAHRLWEWFFQRLETIVIDEVHAYRGVFGSHVSLVLRRLNRLAERFDSGEPRSPERRTQSAGTPQYVCCSATIGNPVGHAATVTNQPEPSFRLLTKDDSATGPRQWVVWNPPEKRGGGGHGQRRSHHVEAKRLFADLVQRGLQTAVFTGSRQVAERYATESERELRERGAGELATKIGAYQAALTSDRRRELEAGLHDGSIRGVWTTSALELGVDVGGLDAVVLDGYPGTRMETFQRAGRAGRGEDPALVALVTGEDQLDQYVARHPEALFDREPEQALTNPANDQILPDHVRSAARENWLSPGDDRHFGETFPDVVADLESRGDLERRTTDAGTRWLYDGGGSPAHETSLRSADDREIKLRERGSNDVIASLPFGDALRDAHPGAIYHHQGTKYEVVDLDLDHDVATLDRTYADQYTRVLHEKTITVEADLREKPFPGRESVPVRFADVTMHKQITGFERHDARSGEAISRESLDVPETSLRTRALYYALPPELEADLRAAGDFPGGIHAAEHAMIATMPLSFLCDRRDIGGLSTPHHPHTDRSTIFIYDGYPGGVGIAEAGYESIGDLAATTGELVADCDCEDGCPACVQSPHCGNANDPLDKGLAIELLEALVEGDNASE